MLRSIIFTDCESFEMHLQCIPSHLMCDSLVNFLVLFLDSASSMLKITKERTSSRRHPYANPYSFSDGRSTADVDSVSDISEWILDDKIKDILYGNQEVMFYTEFIIVTSVVLKKTQKTDV